MKQTVFFIFSFLVVFTLSTEIYAQNESPLPNDTRWVRESKEYKSICEQTYKAAWHSLKKRRKGNMTPVIVMDLDETVLDNSLYQVQLHKKSERYNPKTWNNFVKLEISGLVPGAKEFILNFKKQMNGVIIFISDRDASTLKATKNNLDKVGVLFDDDIFLLKKNKEDIKEVRRREVFEGTGRMKKHGSKHIMAYFGDQMGDFPKNNRYTFSIDKFIFPNPMYGRW